jgi:hypothetical protein
MNLEQGIADQVEKSIEVEFKDRSELERRFILQDCERIYGPMVRRLEAAFNKFRKKTSENSDGPDRFSVDEGRTSNRDSGSQGS